MTCPRCNGPANEETLREFGGVCPKCLLNFSEEQDAPAFPNLEIVELIGQGGMGVVYKARQKNLDRFVALKVLSPHLSEDPEFVERFTREARALAQLSHPNIVAIHDSGIHDRVPHLVMEFIDGAPLRGALASGKLTPSRALEVIPQICDALQYAHSHGVVHRDIKPENILIDRQGRVKIADFGLAKLSADQSKITMSGYVLGTPRYMAPEQFEPSGRVDHRADIYSLGVVFYEMLTGEVPMGKFKPPSAKADVDQRLDPVVLKSLEREPDDRYQSAGEVKDEVAGLNNRKDERRKPVVVVRNSNPLRKASFVIANIGGLTIGAAFVLKLLRIHGPADTLMSIGVAILVAALVLWLLSLLFNPRTIAGAPAPRRSPALGCLIAIIACAAIAAMLFIALLIPVSAGSSAARVESGPMGVVVSGPPKRDSGSSFHLEDAWPKPTDLPSGLRLENVREGKAVFPEKPSAPDPDTVVKGGNWADALPDMKLIRKATLAEGKVHLIGIEFKTDYARRRWQKELQMLVLPFEDGKEPDGRSVFTLGSSEFPAGPAASAAMEMMLPVLRRKMKEAAAKYRE